MLFWLVVSYIYTHVHTHICITYMYVYIYINIYIYTHTLWLFNVAMGNVPFIDDKHEDLPINSMVIFSMATLVSHNQRVYITHE